MNECLLTSHTADFLTLLEDWYRAAIIETAELWKRWCHHSSQPLRESLPSSSYLLFWEPTSSIPTRFSSNGCWLAYGAVNLSGVLFAAPLPDHCHREMNSYGDNDAESLSTSITSKKFASGSHSWRSSNMPRAGVDPLEKMRGGVSWFDLHLRRIPCGASLAKEMFYQSWRGFDADKSHLWQESIGRSKSDYPQPVIWNVSPRYGTHCWAPCRLSDFRDKHRHSSGRNPVIAEVARSCKDEKASHCLWTNPPTWEDGLSACVTLWKADFLSLLTWWLDNRDVETRQFQLTTATK